MCTFWASLQGLWFCNRSMILVCNADWLSALFFADDLTCKSESDSIFPKKTKKSYDNSSYVFITRVMLTALEVPASHMASRPAGPSPSRPGPGPARGRGPMIPRVTETQARRSTRRRLQSESCQCQ